MDALRVKKWGKRAAIVFGGLLLFLAIAVAALFIWLGTASSRNLLLGIAAEALQRQGLYLKVESSRGQLPFELELKGVSLSDSQGLWLSLPLVKLELSPFKLFGLVAQVDSLRLEGLSILRLPVLPQAASQEAPLAEDAKGKGLSLPLDIRVDEFALLNAGLDPEFLALLLPERREALMALGRLGLKLYASAAVQRGAIMEPGNITLNVKSDFDLPEGSALSLALFTGPERGLADSLRLDILLSEAGPGVLSALSGLEKLPAYSLRLSSESSLSDIGLDLQLNAERLAAVSGRIGLVPLGSGLLRRQDSLERLLGPNWQADMALKVEPGPLLSEDGSPFALLPKALLELMGREAHLALKGKSDISQGTTSFDIESLSLDSPTLRAALEKARLSLVPAAGGQHLSFGGALLAELKEGDFFATLGLAQDEVPILDKASLRLITDAVLDFPAPASESGGPAGTLKANFKLKGPLTLESRHPMLAEANAGAPASLAANLELAGAYSEALTLDLLRLAGLGLNIDGKASAVFEPLLASLDLEISGERSGQWNKILMGINENIPQTGFKASLTARANQQAAKGADEASAQLKLALTDCAWPIEELQRGLGPHLGLLAHFSGPLASPYNLTLDGIISGPKPVTPAAYEPAWSGEAFAGLRARGGAKLILPKGASKQPADLEAKLDWALGDMGLFLPEDIGFSGPVRGFASAKGKLGGADTAINMNAWLSNYAAESIESPIGSLVLGAEAGAQLNMRDGLDLVGQIVLNANSEKSGNVILNSDLALRQPDGQDLSLAVKKLYAAFAGLSLTGDLNLVLPDAAALPKTRPPFSAPSAALPPADAPRIEGALQAHFEDWQELCAILRRLDLAVPPINGNPLDINVKFSPLAAGQAVNVDLQLDDLFMFMDAAESWWRLPKPAQSASLLAQPGMIILHGLGGKLEVTDLWGQRLVSGHLKSDAGSVDAESWQSLALFVDLLGNVGRVNMAVRGDADALEVAQAAAKSAPPFSAALASSYLGGKAAAPKAASDGTTENVGAKAKAGLSDIETASLSGMFRLDPLAIYLDRAAFYSPEFETGFYLVSPALVQVADAISIENVNFAVLPAGHLKADAYLSSQSSKLVADIKDLPLGLIRALVNVPLPDGELNLTSRMDRQGNEISGNTELTALLRPAYQDPGTTVTPLLLQLTSKMSKESSEFKLPTRAGIARITGSGTLAEAPALDALATDAPPRPKDANMHLAFDLPCRVNQQGIVVPDYHEQAAASLSWRGDLGKLWHILPIADRYLGGIAQMDFKLGGKLARLEYSGSAYLAGGRYEDRVLGMMLSDMKLEALFGGQGSRLNFSAGDGEDGKIAMAARLTDTGIINTGLDGGPGFSWPDLTASAQINHLAPLHRDDLYIRLSGILDASGPLLAPLVEGKFEIEQGVLNLMASLGGGVTTLPVEEQSYDELVKVPKQSAMLDISVEAPRRFYVRGPGLDSEWRASATVTGPADSPIFSATVKPVRGYFDMLSRPFNFTSGHVELWGSGDYLDSNLDLLLTHSRADIEAQINAKGSIKRPKLELGSKPPLPQDQILAQVLFGKDITQLSAIEAVQVANGVRQLMSFGQGGFDLMGGVRNLLGVDTLRIGSSGGGQQSSNISGSPDAASFGVGGAEEAESSPTVEAGKYINDSIYVGVEQGTTESSTRVRVEVELKPNLTLQGSSGTDSSQVGLGWKRDY